MNPIRNLLDRRREGTHYADRMHRILGVCHACGILWHEERVTYRNGQSEVKRVDDIEPVGTVLVTPQYEKYGLSVNPRVLPRLKGMADQFAYALNVPATAIEVDGNVVYVRVPRELTEHTLLVTYEQAWKIEPDIPRGSLLLGVDEAQHQLVLDFTESTNVHAAVIGMTGSGKSTLLRTMVLSAQMVGGARVALFDPSNGLYPFSGHPSVWRGGLFRRAEDCALGLQALAETLDTDPRVRQHSESRALRDGSGFLYVFVDEVPDLIMQRPAIREHLARLAQAGRHAGIHLILGAQHLLASQIGAMTLRNIPVRLIGRVADRTAAYNAAGRADSGAEHLRGHGDFIAVSGGTTCHFQAAYTAPEILEEWMRRYPPREPRVPVRPSRPGRHTGATAVPEAVVELDEGQTIESTVQPAECSSGGAREKNTPNTGRHYQVERHLNPAPAGYTPPDPAQTALCQRYPELVQAMRVYAREHPDGLTAYRVQLLSKAVYEREVRHQTAKALAEAVWGSA